MSFSHGMFQFEVKMNAQIPANPSPGFSVNVNHLGTVFGILTDRMTAGPAFNFMGHTDVYHFNFLVGALYSVADSGLGIGLGWKAFVINNSTSALVEIPLEIREHTLFFETSASSLGNPASFTWAAGSECDPVPSPEEKSRTTILVDFAPDHGVVSWPCAGR